MNQYDKQASKFLTNTDTTISKQFIGLTSHFDTDKKDGIERPVYNIVIRRVRRYKPLGKPTYSKNLSYTFKFGDSIANKQDGKTPTNYDILTCLTKYDPCDFEDFCSEYGYDTDSRTALKTYKAVKREYKNMARLYTSKELEELSEIQ